MSEDPKSFEDFKNKMEKHWKEEIIPPDVLKKRSSDFFINHILEYSTNCLFLELLDLQINLPEKYKNFPYIYPVYEENCLSILRKPDDEKINYIIKGNLVADADSIITRDETKSNLRKFLQDYPAFDYYFWNVTFPNVFLGFISDEYCDNAVELLNYFKNEKEIFLKGVKSFIIHNYYFQDSFMKSFFINSQKENAQENNLEKNLQNSLKKSIQKLTIQQLSMLENLIDNYPNEAMKLFIDDIIIRNIKLWKYSPLYSPFQDGQIKENETINHLNEQFIKGEKHEENLKTFLDPIFKEVKNKTTINEIKIPRIIFDSSHKFVYTFLDILIIEKIANNNRYNAQIGPLLEKFDEKYLIQKAFYYMCFEKSESCPKDMEAKLKVKEPSFDVAYTNKWSIHKDECVKHNKNPLEVFYNEEELQKLLKHDPELAYTGIATSYYAWRKYSNMKNVLKEESRALIPLKAILESQNNFMEIYSTFYASTHPISHENFLDNLKNLFKDKMKNILLKNIKMKFKQNKYYYTLIVKAYQQIRAERAKKSGPKKKINEKKIKECNDKIQKHKTERTALYHEIISDFTKKIDNEFSQNFDYYFNNKESAENLYNLLNNIIAELISRLDPNARASLTSYRSGFDKYFEYMGYLTRAYLITSYNDAKIKVVPLSTNIDFINYDNITHESFLPYAVSGIFNYIGNFVDSLKSSDFESTNMISIGQVFAAVPIIKKFLEQFIASQFTMSFMIVNSIDNEKYLTMLILEYAFKFYSQENSKDKEKGSDKDPENLTPEEKQAALNKKTSNFIQFLATAFNELNTFNNSLPYFDKLDDEFLFLKQYIPI